MYRTPPQRRGATKILHLNALCQPVHCSPYIFKMPLGADMVALELIGQVHKPHYRDYLPIVTSVLEQIGWTPDRNPDGYGVNGSSTGGLVGICMAETDNPPKWFRVFEPPLHTGRQARQLHNSVLRKTVENLVEKSYQEARAMLRLAEQKHDRRLLKRLTLKTQEALKNWWALRASGHAWPLLESIASHRYSDHPISLPGKVILSQNDAVFPPTAAAVADLQAGLPNANITILKSYNRFQPLHSWPQVYPRLACSILLRPEYQVPEHLQAEPIPDSDFLAAEAAARRRTQYAAAGLVGLGALAILTYTRRRAAR